MHKSVENALCTYFIFNGITNLSVNYVNWEEASISVLCILNYEFTSNLHCACLSPHYIQFCVWVTILKVGIFECLL